MQNVKISLKAELQPQFMTFLYGGKSSFNKILEFITNPSLGFLEICAFPQSAADMVDSFCSNSDHAAMVFREINYFKENVVKSIFGANIHLL